MVEKRFCCVECKWTPQNKEEQSVICPKCGNECRQMNVISKEEVQALQDELINKNNN